MKILFVCQGNTCRSPMAEALARRFGGGDIEAVSAGLRPGKRLTELTRQALAEVQLELPDHHPQPLEAVERPVDCVISLCEVIHPGLDLFPNARRYHWRIPDPIGGPIEAYRETRDLIWDHLRPLLARLTESDSLPERLEEEQ